MNMKKWWKNLFLGWRFSKSVSSEGSAKSGNSSYRADKLGIRKYPRCQFFPVKKIGEIFIVFGDTFQKVSHNKAIRQFDGSVWIYSTDTKDLSLRSGQPISV